MTGSPEHADHTADVGGRRIAWAGLEVALIVALFLALCGGAPPGVNEAHYLAKAKHYWDPSWCAGDHFLESADAHLVFYWTFGWLTLLAPLGTVAWIGRLVTWTLLAWSWRRLSVSVAPGRLTAVLTFGLFACFLNCGHLAGEWVVGGVEAKGLAYVLALLALAELVRGRWNRVWLLLGASAAFHVLVGGWGVIAALLAWSWSGKSRPPLRAMSAALAGGLLLSLPGLLPGLALGWGVDGETVRQANHIYVHLRLDHHLVFHQILQQPLRLDFRHLGGDLVTFEMTHLFLLRHLALFAVWGVLCWFVRPAGEARRLHLFVAAVCLIAALGMLIDQLTIPYPHVAARLLRYYWFRLSDVMLPLGAALIIGQGIGRLAGGRALAARGCLAAAWLVVALQVSDALLRLMWDPRPAAVRQTDRRDAQSRQRFEQWQAVCQWIGTRTSPHDVFLTPRGQQTFKWYAQRAEVVNWKDIPQDARGIVEWWQRMQEIYPFDVERRGLAAHGERRLRALAAKYRFRYILLDRRKSRWAPNFLRVYPPPGAAGATFEVYRVPNDVR